MSSLVEQKTGVYLGNRGKPFKEFISGLLKLGKLKNKYIELLTNDESMKAYSSAFTSELVDAENNYQVFEQIGDLSGNKIIVSYMYKRFPQLNCFEGVKVIARLRINYGAKQSFAEIARKLGFWDFISATNETRYRRMKPLLEDVFEAFLGATEFLIDNYKRVGVGYAIVYDILSRIFDDIDISLRYEDLYDSKTRLKELFDTYETTLGTLLYKEQKQDHLTISSVYRVVSEKQSSNKKEDKLIKIGEGSAALKVESQQIASTAALITLAKQGYSKPVPKIYQRFSEQKNVKESEIIDEKMVKKLWNDINALYLTKEKSRYQTKYQSTPICLYARKRNTSGVLACLANGANPNIPDSEGLYATDLLLIGKKDLNTVKSIMSVMIQKTDNLKMSFYIFKMYYMLYRNEDPFFIEVLNRLDITNPEFVSVMSNVNKNGEEEEIDE